MKMNVKFNESSIAGMEKRLIKRFNKIIQSEELAADVAKVIIDDIKFQTKSGKSIPNNMRRFKKLSPRWIGERKRIAESNPTSDVYAPDRSNLSLTGQLLDSLKWERLKNGIIEIGFAGIHKAYSIKRIRGKNAGKNVQVGKNIPNEDLARYVSEVRPFMGIRSTVVARIKKIVIGYIRRSAR